MLTLRALPGERYEDTLMRTLREQAPPELRDLVVHVEQAFRKATTPPPASLHPDAVPELSNDERMSRLAESFPVLHGRPGVRPWKPTLLLEQWEEAWTSNASRQALAFVMSVWNTHCETGKRFNASLAMSLWDHRQRAAFAAWVQKPWWM